MHAFADLEVEETFEGNVDVVLVPDFSPYFGGLDSHVLVIGHVGADIEVGNVDA